MSDPTINVWPALGTTVTLASGFVITAVGAVAVRTDEISRLLAAYALLTFDPTHVNPNPSPIPPDQQGGLTSDLTAGLAATVSFVVGDVGATYGTSAVNDGPQGFWLRDPASTTPANTGTVLGTGTGRWKRVRDRQFINVKWFGAKGDGVTDDRAAIQAAINAATDILSPAIYPGCDVYIPSGNYLISGTIYCRRSASCEGLRIYGPDTPGSTVTSCRLLWTGTSFDYATPATQVPMFWSVGNDFSFETFSVSSSSFKTLYSAFEVGAETGVAVAITHNKFIGISVVGDVNSHIYCGVSVGSIHPQGSNLENFVFEDCNFSSMGFPGVGDGAGVYIASGQPINTTFLRCHFQDSLGGVKGMIGLRVGAASCTAQLTDCDFQSLEMGVQGVGCNAVVALVGGEAENCKKLFYDSFLASGVPGSFSARNMRLSPAKVTEATRNFSGGDHCYIDAQSGGGLVLDNCHFTNGPSDPVNVALVRFKQGSPVVVTNCDFSTPTPFVPITDSVRNLTAGIWAHGNRYYVGDGSQMVMLVTYAGGLNPSATATVAGAATAQSVTFAQTEFDSTYFVRLDVESVTGAPAAGAFTAYATSKSATGFTITVPTAPGVGTTVVYRYTVYR